MKAANLVGRNLAEMGALISCIDGEQRGIPIPLRQYLKLGGKLLEFNQDPQFGEVIDGLLVVDLTKTDPQVLEPYMGKRGITTFLAHQQPSLLQQVSCGIEDVLGG